LNAKHQMRRNGTNHIKSRSQIKLKLVLLLQQLLQPLNYKYYTVFHKKPDPKAGRHKFIKKNSFKMIFYTVHCHSVADSLCLKSLVWAEYQLHGFHSNKSRRKRSGPTWNRRLWTRPLTSGGNDPKPASRPKDNILNIYYNFSRTCRLLVPTFFRH